MKRIKASEFKAKCLRLMDEVANTGQPLIVTKSGRPVARLVPYFDRPESLWGLHAELVEIRDDLVAPVGDAWEADS